MCNQYKRPLDRCVGSEDGFTIIEVLIAAFILVLGALAIFMTFTAAIHNIQRSRETQQGISVAQREMERVKVESFAQIGLKSVPTRVATATAPESRISSGGTEFNLSRTGTARYRPLLTGNLPPKIENVRSKDGTLMTVYRFIVCEEAGVTTGCLSKRIVIDVQTTPAKNQTGYKHSYYELQSTVTSASGT